MNVSILVPVFNQWELTRACLKAVAATTRDHATEVLVLDNASTDVTPQACQALGRRLFGAAFQYHRFSTNRNFGPACNAGARLACGDYLVFLNNDTVPLPGWLDPLLDDFSTWTDIAATGPLLLFPERAPFGHTVQHMGAFLSPFLRVGHLYEGIPARSPLAAKRRFFQFITAACLMVPRALFHDAGGFDEHYVNGLEDVDLCARLKEKGYRITVNPAARVIHNASQTPGRHAHERANYEYFTRHCLPLLTPDWHTHVEQDGMVLQLGPWQTVQASLPKPQCRRLDAVASSLPGGELKNLLTDFPFWEGGWRALLEKNEDGAERESLHEALLRLYACPPETLDLCRSALTAKNRARAASLVRGLAAFCSPVEEYVSTARTLRQMCERFGLTDLAGQYDSWTERAAWFEKELLSPFLADLCRLAAQSGLDRQLQGPWLEAARRACEQG